VDGRGGNDNVNTRLLETSLLVRRVRSEKNFTPTLGYLLLGRGDLGRKLKVADCRGLKVDTENHVAVNCSPEK